MSLLYARLSVGIGPWFNKKCNLIIYKIDIEDHVNNVDNSDVVYLYIYYYKENVTCYTGFNQIII